MRLGSRVNKSEFSYKLRVFQKSLNCPKSLRNTFCIINTVNANPKIFYLHAYFLEYVLFQ